MKRDGLTNQQYRVARLVADGKTDRQIAAALGIEEQTVRFHIWRIALAWQLDPQGNTRVQIATRVLKSAA